MNIETVGQPRRRPKWLLIGGGIILAVIVLSRCSSDDAIDPQKWSCQSLAKPIMAMSKGKAREILEMTDIKEDMNDPGKSIRCYASIESSQGQGGMLYGAHVSDGGSVILEYNIP